MALTTAHVHANAIVVTENRVGRGFGSAEKFSPKVFEV